MKLVLCMMLAAVMVVAQAAPAAYFESVHDLETQAENCP
jgi:hypothetical protein